MQRLRVGRPPAGLVSCVDWSTGWDPVGRRLGRVRRSILNRRRTCTWVAFSAPTSSCDVSLGAPQDPWQTGPSKAQSAVDGTSTHCISPMKAHLQWRPGVRISKKHTVHVWKNTTHPVFVTAQETRIRATSFVRLQQRTRMIATITSVTHV